MNKGKYWEEMETIHQDEPIIETEQFNIVRDLMIDTMKNGTDNGEQILEKLFDGAWDYIKDCMEDDTSINDESEESTNEEKEHDDRERAHDLKESIAAQTRSIYGVE